MGFQRDSWSLGTLRERCNSVLCSALLLWPFLTAGQSEPAVAPATELQQKLLFEQRHFVDCLAFGYDPGLWMSYQGTLYFNPKNENQIQTIERMKAERAGYVVFTNLQSRHDFAARLIAESKIEEAWQRKLVIPWSETNHNLMPVLQKPMEFLPSYKLLQSLGRGDALLQDGEAIYFVMEYGGGAANVGRTNAWLIREGTKTYRTIKGVSKTVEAFTDVSLSSEETAVLNRVVVSLRKRSATLGQEVAQLKANQDFELHKARADDTNPFMQYLVAKDYLEGQGTPKDQILGLDWMKRAARNGSGEATTYLERLKSPAQ